MGPPRTRAGVPAAVIMLCLRWRRGVPVRAGGLLVMTMFATKHTLDLLLTVTHGTHRSATILCEYIMRAAQYTGGPCISI